ncbi:MULTISPECIES: outer membrane lipoprotein chaperone LolA [Marinobacter]|uniref:Outer-membrane lipoprotein carrier protein n=1 Tax=Marinobacter xiaoshiensis TaxID=3073652 RepID=A0ABU2HHG1_9GAMM|nr:MULTISPECIES: outer membrane lipoprotein chaperone LolA [unclassified Marinobacter]MBK1886019.1 outer membrane lipoprotein chaperone LolA [Marinobacter sp. DY40_1A1]MDS1310467.1 outer membrane lipoprotein chaperone LolA [Marinobacter sp. F60267]
MQQLFLKRLSALVATLTVAVLFSGSLLAAGKDGSATELASLLKSYETYQADFIQIVVSENGNNVQETRGLLKAKRPGLFYWETRAPLSQLIVSDGKSVEVYDPDLEQVTIHSLDDRVQNTPALLLSGEVDNLEETYRVSGRQISEDTREFTLEPKNEDSLFVSLRLTFFNNELQEMRMQDSLSQLSVLSFDHIRLNETVERSVFKLEYPEGVDVIRDDN